MTKKRIRLVDLGEITKFPAFVPAKKKGCRDRHGVSNCRHKSGLYFIFENRVLVYIGMSRSNVESALYRHFQEWTDQRYYAHYPNKHICRITYKDKLKKNTYEVGIILLEAEEVMDYEKGFIIEHNPRDNRQKYENYTEEFKIAEVSPHTFEDKVGEIAAGPEFIPF